MDKLLPILFFFLLSTPFYGQKDSMYVKKLLDKAYAFEQTNMDSAIAIYKNATKIADKINYWIGAGRATSYTGIVYSDYGFNDSAIVYHKKSIPLYEKAQFKDGVASSLINIGNAYQFLGDYDNSIDYYMRGIELYETMRDTSRLIIAYGNLASLFNDFKMLDKAKNYQQIALDYSININDSISICYLLNDIGYTYLSLKDTTQSLQSFKQALDIANKYEVSELQYFSNQNLSNYYFENKNYREAVKHASLSYENAKSTKKPYYECHALNDLGKSYLLLNKPDSASFYVEKALSIASQINAKEYVMNAYEILNKVQILKGNYKDAYSSLQKFADLRDSIVGKEHQQYITKLEQQYQVKQKDNAILEQQLTIRKNETLIQLKRNQNTIYLISAFILLFVAFLLWYRQRQKQKLHKQKIITLNEQNKLTSLEALIEGENKERTRIAKDLHDSVNGNLSAIKYNLSTISKDQLNQKDNTIFNDAINMLDLACDQIRNLSHDLVPPSLLNYGLIEALEQYLNRVNSLGIVDISFQVFGTLYPCTKKTETIIYNIIQELITNIVKHAKAKKALVQINANLNLLHITVEDDGIGYDINRTSHGLGLQNINSRVKVLNAEMDVKSDHNGTSVNINISLPKYLKS